MNVRMLLTLTLAVVFLAVTRHGSAQDPSDVETSTDQSAADQPKSTYVPITTLDPRIPREELLVMVRPLTKSELEVEAEAWFRLLRNKARQIAAVRLGVRRTAALISADEPGTSEEALQEIESVKQYVDDLAEKAEEEISQGARESLGVVPDPTAETDPLADPSTDPDSDPGTNSAEGGDDGSPESGDSAPQSGADAAPSDAAPSDAAADRRQELLADIPTLQDERTALADRFEIVLSSLELKGGDVTEYRQYASAISGLELDTSDLATTWAAVVGWLNSKEGGQRWAWNIVNFLVILLVSFLVAKIVASCVNWLQNRKLRMTELAKRLISGTIKNVVMLIGFAIALTALEVDITPLLAAIGATGLVVGLALQGTLSNFASGLMILVNRPFDVGNVVSAAGVTGTIHQMNLVSTTFRTFDNQTIHVPNNEIWNGVITNITANKTRRVDLEFGIGYDDDFEQAERIIREVAESHPLVLADPAAVIITHELADSSVNIVCRPWANTSDWWQVRTEITREVKRRLDREGISIPYPQRDVHLHQVDGRASTEGIESKAEPR